MDRAAQQPAVLGERGLALVIAVFAIVVLGALVVASFFAATEEQRLAENARRVARAHGVTEAGLADLLVDGDPQEYNAIPAYPAGSLAVTRQITSGLGYAGFVSRLNATTFLVDVTGFNHTTVATAGARARIGLLARLQPAQVDLRAALTSHGDVSVQGGVGIEGWDRAPAGWASCDPADSGVAGIRTSGVLRADDTTAVSGAPPVWRDPGLSDSSRFAELAGRAHITLPEGGYAIGPSARGSACDRTVPTNWGDGLTPGGACRGYAPIVLVTGNATVQRGQGQGILLVDGDLTLEGGAEFVGVVLVRGVLRSGQGGAYVTGAVVAGGVDAAAGHTTGRPFVQYSKCAIDNALRAGGTVAPLRSRSWVLLF